MEIASRAVNSAIGEGEDIGHRANNSAQFAGVTQRSVVRATLRNTPNRKTCETFVKTGVLSKRGGRRCVGKASDLRRTFLRQIPWLRVRAVEM
ncbi:hypothetical protein [Yoonia sp. R2-816]|uniref:hypothetical protein n=1 Tax=Yoonia sp. R2-816 TaxID=3342638 RepID=UPI00372D1D16